MVDVRQGVPEGRYSRPRKGARADAPAGAADGRGAGDEARADRKLKIVGAVLGALLVALIAWLGVSYINGQGVSGELIKFKIVSAEAVEAHLEVRKDTGVSGTCTLRTQAENGSEVGRKSVTFGKDTGRTDRVITIRTTSRATSAELVGCQTD